MLRHRSRVFRLARALRLVAAAGALLAASCVGGDAPTNPNLPAGSARAQLTVAPRFASSAAESASAAAQADAFDHLTCFRLVAVRVPGGETAVDRTFTESPGQPTYTLSVDVDLQTSPETFEVTITAYAPSGGQACGIELFSGTSEVSVQANELDGSASGSSPAPLTLTPSGPQLAASSLTLDPGYAVLSRGGTAQLSPTLLGASGDVIQAGAELAGVLSWSSSNSSAASVDGSGKVTGGSDGVAQITATTVTGLSTTIPVYVANGRFAYVTGGSVVVTKVDGQGLETVADGASRPAWGPGGMLAYDAGGSVVGVGVGTLIPGAGSPTFSPDGVHVTGYGGGLVHATVDGKHHNEEPVPGPANPQWVDASHLIGDGSGGLVRVKADGTEETQVTTNASDHLPSVGGGYFLSSRDGGSMGVFHLTGGGSATRITPDGFTASGRPSAGGGWILVPGSGSRGGGLNLVPAGGGDPLPLPIAGGSDPAWEAAPGGGGSPTLTLTDLDPARPVGGQDVTIHGSGFDWIVPTGNVVKVPVRSATASAPGAPGAASGETVEAKVTDVAEDHVTFHAPDDMVPGTLTVQNAYGQATLDLTPATGDLDVQVRTPSGDPVAGVSVEATGPGDTGSTTTAVTGDDGNAAFPGVSVGDYALSLATPEGFTLDPTTASATVSLDATATVSVTATPLPWSVSLSTDEIDFDRVGQTRSFDVSVTDIDGHAMTAPFDVERIPGSVVLATVNGSRVELESIASGQADVIVSVTSPASAPAAGSANAASSEPSLQAQLHVVVPVPSEPPGSLVGNVYDASSGGGVDGATVSIRNQTTGVVTTVTTDASGGYQADGLLAGSYRITVTANGFEQATASADVAGGQTTTVSPIGMVTAGIGNLDVTAEDAVSTGRLGSATVELRNGSGSPDSDPVVATGTTDQTGVFSFSGLPSGNYTIRVIAQGYVDAHANATVQTDVTTNRTVLLSPQVPAGQIRVVLTWGPPPPAGVSYYNWAVPSDLDSHLTGPYDGTSQLVNSDLDVIGGVQRFHIFYQDEGSQYNAPWAYLDQDVVSYQGPETTTITQVQQGTYRFSVDCYTCEYSELPTSIRGSQARVQVYTSSGLVADFSVPNQDGLIWVVFDIVNGAIVPVNRVYPMQVRMYDYPTNYEPAHPGFVPPPTNSILPTPGRRMAPSVQGGRNGKRQVPEKVVDPSNFRTRIDFEHFRERVLKNHLPYVVVDDASAPHGAAEPSRPR